MACEAETVERLLSQRRIGRSDTIVLVLAALSLATGAAAWIADAGQATALTSAALPGSYTSFEDRFVPASTDQSAGAKSSLASVDVYASALRETMLRGARDELAVHLSSGDWRPATDGEAKLATAVAIPLPRSRPVAVDQSSRSASEPVAADAAPASDNRTLLQKLSDLLPGRIRLASLTPDSGLFSRGPDLAALGYDRQTAVYDITARAVYLPSGIRLEAHSGMGSLKDDPEHVHERMVGATPPAIYDLKPRERLFHGVRALRMIPADGSNTLGRSGLLTHSYMLGPNGDSNGCVSIKDYERFLKAFDDGEFSRIVVVPTLSGTASVSQRSPSES